MNIRAFHESIEKSIDCAGAMFGTFIQAANSIENLEDGLYAMEYRGDYDFDDLFCVELSDYPNIGADSTRLVVFFSRMGYVKKQAYEAANRTGAQAYEIKAAERTEGTAGFWWCGRFAMHRWPMPIQPVALDLTAYDHVTICSPIWVFYLAFPVRELCRQAAGKIKEADYVLVHHTKGNYESVAKEMDRLLGITHRSSVNVRCRMGTFDICK